MTRAQRWGWVALAIIAALILLFLARSAAAQDYAFMPRGGCTLLLELLGTPANVSEPRFYFDTDHLNRAGLAQFVARDLRPLLASGP